ncbi:MAG: molybdopterin dinucleotide binding domain-containing protein, partial [Candidatus Nanopelagicales bacterium]
GAPAPQAAPGRESATGTIGLATWRLLLDAGALQEGEPHLAATARPTEALMSESTARGLGLSDGADITIQAASGAITVPLRVADVVDGAVWLPMTSEGSRVLAVGASHGDRVRVLGGGA